MGLKIKCLNNIEKLGFKNEDIKLIKQNIYLKVYYMPRYVSTLETVLGH